MTDYTITHQKILMTKKLMIAFSTEVKSIRKHCKVENTELFMLRNTKNVERT